jgi:predicted dienelactone hydrolase
MGDFESDCELVGVPEQILATLSSVILRKRYHLPMYDPFVSGRFTVAERTLQVFDSIRDRSFPGNVWHPTEPAETCPVILLSHSSGGTGPRDYTFLANHLASHGYIVARLCHSERVAPELALREAKTPEQLASRVEDIIASRVPDIRVLLDHVLSEARIEPAPVGIVGHSFGGWTALASPDVLNQIEAVVALAPAGSSKPRPGILPAKLAFNRRSHDPSGGGKRRLPSA